MPKHKNLRVAIIGAGASGILAAIKLRESGIEEILVFEKGDELGGTWRDNQYPGVACDVPSHAYRYTFAPNAEWSRHYSPGAEILEYLKKTAADYRVDGFIRYQEEVVRAEYVDNKWQLETTSGDQGVFDIVISAAGILHHPVYPDIAGLHDFEGRIMHSACWDKSLNYAGKRVGIIGNGSTGTQIISAMVDDVATLTIFQRTPQWIIPSANSVTTQEQKTEFRKNPGLMQDQYDQIITMMNDLFAAAIVGENPEAYELISQSCQDNLQSVKDPVLREKLTPDYKVGCKRLVLSGSFYDDIQKSNVALVTDAIDSICAQGIRTVDGDLHELDILVLATGFDPHRFLRPMDVRGLNGVKLEEEWADQNRSYLTVTIPEFPNFFMLGGPSSPIGNFSYLLTAETQIGFILQLVERLRKSDVSSISPRKSACDAFNEALQEKMAGTVWTSGCASWYLDKNGNVASWPWSYDKFTTDLSEPRWEDFELA